MFVPFFNILQTENSIQSQTNISIDIRNVVDSLMNRFDEESMNTTNTECKFAALLFFLIKKSLFQLYQQQMMYRWMMEIEV